MLSQVENLKEIIRSFIVMRDTCVKYGVITHWIINFYGDASDLYDYMCIICKDDCSILKGELVTDLEELFG